MATIAHDPNLRLVTVDGVQIAPAPRLRSRDKDLREDREITLAIIHEHLGHLTNEMADITHAIGHITHSLDRLKTLAKELEGSLGISIPEFKPHPLPKRPDQSG
jgi:hypothetical protein